MKLRVKLCAEDLHRTYCRYFRTKLFNEVFLMALTSTEQLFIVRPLFPVTSVKTFLCNVIGFTIFIQKQSLEVFCLKRGLRNFAIFAGMLANSFLKESCRLRQLLLILIVSSLEDFFVCFISTET